MKNQDEKKRQSEAVSFSKLAQIELEKLKPETYLTRKEVAGMFKVDLSTIHNWTKRKILTSYGLGGRVYYKLSEINESLVKLNSNEIE